MTVKIKKKQEILGELVEVSQYEPSNEALTKEKREKANMLDDELKVLCERINKKYENLDSKVKTNKIEKWKWLGCELANILRNAKNIEITDIDNHYIWPAIGQHFRKELKRGYGKRRSGTSKDHFRKCWLLATLENTEWINSWSGWDAFVDRGEQIIKNTRIMKMLGNEFGEIKLNPRDYQMISKMIVSYLPSRSDQAVDINSMTDQKIQRIIKIVYKEFVQKSSKLNN